jgi:hypothetical protein
MSGPFSSRDVNIIRCNELSVAELFDCASVALEGRVKIVRRSWPRQSKRALFFQCFPSAAVIRLHGDVSMCLFSPGGF